MNAYKTAISRKKLSTPARFLHETGKLNGDCLDFGCGKGFDCDHLNIQGYDPHYRDNNLTAYDTIMCNYVLNVCYEDEQKNIIEKIKGLLKPTGTAYLTVRNDKKNLNGITKKGTYQTFVNLDLPIIKKTGSFVMYVLKK